MMQNWNGDHARRKPHDMPESKAVAIGGDDWYSTTVSTEADFGCVQWTAPAAPRPEG